MSTELTTDEVSTIELQATVERKRSLSKLDPDAAHLQAHHGWDPNLPGDLVEEVELVENEAGDDPTTLAKIAAEESPYPEVQAAVRNYDEEMPASTIRAWTIGLLLVTVCGGLNMLFHLRSPAISISAIVAQFLAYPLGKLWHLIMPQHEIIIFGSRLSLNPGPFNMKEHAVIAVMANAGFGIGAAYSTDVLTAQQAFYGQSFGWGFQLLLTWTTTMMGYGIAGLSRRFVVWPAAMIWPVNLVSTSLFYSLHDHRAADPSVTGGWSIGRYRYFIYVALGSFVWYWIPGFLFKGLSVFTFVTWIKPHNPVINQLFGGISGIALLPLTLDWTVVSAYVLSPLIPPWYAIANTLIGVIAFFWITSIAVHFSGISFAKYIPMGTSSVYDNTGAVYNVSRVLNPDLSLNTEAYEAYSPLFLPTTYAMSFGVSFAMVVSVLINTALFHGKEIWLRAKLARKQEDDVHMRLMKKYTDAPDWWYVTLFVFMLGLSFGVIYAWDTQTPWWVLLVAIIIPMIWTIPMGMVHAMTNVQLGLNVLTELLVGYIYPGKPMAMMLFKAYGYMTMYQALSFAQDLKLGHYMKVPPRALFWSQIAATLWSGIVQIAVMNWAFSSIEDICSPEQSNNFTCPGGHVFFSNSIIWGLIGPARIFSSGQLYSNFYWFFLAGAILPVAIYLLTRKYPRSKIRYIVAPVIFAGCGWIPPATPLNYLTWGIVGFTFSYVIRKRYQAWWNHYNYITSAGLDVGLALCTILIFLTLNLTHTSPPNWWGNVITSQTLDYNSAHNVLKKVMPGEIFGPPSGSWH
ncbi:OPT oligopeptide transporter protein-domain-containing protein [Xylogone sp. PMI_703]|nr:OPT oligopeptide transporter protein-domain-containing protein [Xylogone sp. PMI_703]